MIRRHVTVRKGAYEFQVAPYDLWPFWESYADWEPETFEILDRYLADGGTYIDIGAWIGPTVLYAACLADSVVAFEPDPIAFAHLQENVAYNVLSHKVRCMQTAITESIGAVTLYRADGKSMASLLPCVNGFDWPTDTPGQRPPSTPVYGAPLRASVAVTASLVKMDVEGGEALILPAASDWLAANQAPIWLSLHGPWWPDGGEDKIAEALADYTLSEPITRRFGTVLAVPR